MAISKNWATHSWMLKVAFLQFEPRRVE